MARPGAVVGLVLWAAVGLGAWTGVPVRVWGQGSAVPRRGDTLVADIRVQPDTVAIGAPFRVMIHVRAPRGITVQFPVGPDSGGAVEALDPRSVTTATGDSTVTDVTASYRMAAWDLGRQPIGLGPLTARGPEGVRTLPLGDLSIVVASTLPASPAGRRPKPARGIFAGGAAWWKWWAIAAAVLVALMGVVLMVRHWRRRRRLPTVPVGPFAVAERDFADLERLGLLDAGECGRYVALLAEIVRTYLARRVGQASLSSTTTELVGALRDDARVPLDRLQAILSDTDQVKFANRPASTAQARALGGESKALVADIERAIATAESAPTLTAAEMRARRLTPARRPSGNAA